MDAAWSRHSLHLMANLIVFGLCYPLANLLAGQGGVTRHIVFELDHALPFMPWMVLPYMTSSLLFCLSFAAVRSVDELRTLSQRLMLCTVGASLAFLLYPLRFSFERPDVTGPPSMLFDLLALVDQPYNQLPSLHVAYCVVIGTVLRAPLWRAWLVLVAVSTLFTWQHHLVDVLGGLVLGAGALLVIRPQRPAPGVAFYYLMASGVLIVLAQRWAQLMYPAMSCMLIARAYWRGDADFLAKRGGRFPLKSYLLYGPYLLGYWLTWQCVRLRERGHAPYLQLAPLLWVGRRLSGLEARLLPPGCAIVDLANELTETPALRRRDYAHVPLLDLAPPPPEAIERIAAIIAHHHAAGRQVYLHCAMGYSRSIFIARKYKERLSDVPLDLPA